MQPLKYHFEIKLKKNKKCGQSVAVRRLAKDTKVYKNGQYNRLTPLMTKKN